MHKLQNLCILQVGDYYDDGHGKYEILTIPSIDIGGYGLFIRNNYVYTKRIRKYY